MYFEQTIRAIGLFRACTGREDLDGSAMWRQWSQCIILSLRLSVDLEFTQYSLLMFQEAWTKDEAEVAE